MQNDENKDINTPKRLITVLESAQKRTPLQRLDVPASPEVSEAQRKRELHAQLAALET